MTNQNGYVFVDTAFFKALADEKDDFHQSAIKIFEKFKEEQSELITTNFILDETITLIRVRCGLERVRMFRRIIASLSPLKIIRVLTQDEEKAWDWFWNNWKNRGRSAAGRARQACPNRTPRCATGRWVTPEHQKRC